METQEILSGTDVTQNEMPKAQTHILLEIVEYVPDSIVCRTVLKKSNGVVTAFAFDEGEKFCETTHGADLYVQVIDGIAHVTMNKIDHELCKGKGMVIPANVCHCFKAEEQFKMITSMVTLVEPV